MPVTFGLATFRELEHAVERTVNLANGPSIRVRGLALTPTSRAGALAPT
jgi:hypothetical protein